MVNGSGITGGFQGTGLAPKGKRFLSALVDLLIVPILLGVLAGLVLMAVPEAIRNIILIAINIGWLIFRDVVFSPGRKLTNLKLVSADGGPVSIGQAFIRNILLMVPFVLVIGYIVEIVFIAWKGSRLADNWAKTKVVPA
jgi:uncharacterized RDD family membrane protein YckC